MKPNMKKSSLKAVRHSLKIISYGMSLAVYVFLMAHCGCGKKRNLGKPVELRILYWLPLKNRCRRRWKNQTRRPTTGSKTPPPEAVTPAPVQPPPVQPPPVKPVTAYALYEKGVKSFNSGALEEAIELFTKARDRCHAERCPQDEGLRLQKAGKD